MAQVVTQLIVDSSGAKTGVAEFEAAMAKAKRAAVEGGEATASAFERAQARWTQSLAKTDPVIKAQIALERDLARQREINANAVKLGIATQEAANAQLDRVRQQHAAYAAGIGQSGAATQKFAAQTGLARHELINLSRQAQDVVVSLQGGQGIGTVFLQQGSQILDVLGTSQGGIRGALAGLGTSLRSVLTVGRLAFAGIAAAAAGAAYATSSYLDEQKNVERSLIGAGRRSATPGDINRIADERSSATGLSVSETRQAALEFAKTGQIHSRVIGEMIETTRNFALVTGQSSKEAATALASAFTNMPGIDNLNKQFNFLDDSTRRTVETLLQAGRTTEAAALGMEKFGQSIKGAAETQGVLEKGWTAIGNAISNATDKVGQYIAKAAGLQRTSKSERATELEGEISRLENMGGDTGGLTGRIFSGTLEKYRTELAGIKNELAQIAQQDAFNKLSTGAQQAVSVVNPLQSQLDMVVGKLTQLRDAQTQGINIPGLQMAVTYYEQIAQQLQNQMQAQDVLLSKYPGMTAEFAKQVEALRDQNALLKARENGTEATVSAAIAYKNAIAGGANETEAAAIKAETLKNNLLQAASAAGSIQVELDWTDFDNYVAASRSNDPNIIAGGNSGSYTRSSEFAPRTMTQRGDFEVTRPSYEQIMSGLPLSSLATDNELLPRNVFGAYLEEAARRNNENLEEMKRAIEEQKKNTEATAANTAALSVTLHPLYNGRDALQIGYYANADGGLIGPTGRMPLMSVQEYKNGGVANSPQIAMFGEAGPEAFVPLKDGAIPVRIAGGSMNDNRKGSSVTQITQNFDFRGSESSSRRNKRQFAQGFGPVADSLR